jgi:hypothetical protein
MFKVYGLLVKGYSERISVSVPPQCYCIEMKKMAGPGNTAYYDTMEK